MTKAPRSRGGASPVFNYTYLAFVVAIFLRGMRPVTEDLLDRVKELGQKRSH